MTRLTLVNGRSFLDAEKGVGLSKEVADEVVIASQDDVEKTWE